MNCGCSEEIVNAQIEALKPLEKKYKLYWNNRIDRHPEVYTSYSELINHSVVTSKTEWIILINDRTKPTTEEVEKLIDLLEHGFSCVLLYNVGFMGFSKELIRKVGWWDQRFFGGGWEDRDWVFRLKMNNLAIYESQESIYDMSWKSPLNYPWDDSRNLFWQSKYKFVSDTEILKVLSEERYEQWNNLIGESIEEISNSWNSWDKSILNIMYDKPGSGQSSSSMINNKNIIEVI